MVTHPTPPIDDLLPHSRGSCFFFIPSFFHFPVSFWKCMYCIRFLFFSRLIATRRWSVPATPLLHMRFFLCSPFARAKHVLFALLGARASDEWRFYFPAMLPSVSNCSIFPPPCLSSARFAFPPTPVVSNRLCPVVRRGRFPLSSRWSGRRQFSLFRVPRASSRMILSLSLSFG